MKQKINCAFFDVDETIVNFKTMFSFLEYYFEETEGPQGKSKFKQYMDGVKNDWKNNRPREEINREYYLHFANRSQSQLRHIATAWLEKKRNEMGEDFYISQTTEIISKLQKDAVEIVLVSGSLATLIEPVAEELGIRHILATRLEQEGDMLKGDIISPQTIGEGKAIAVRNFIKEHNIDLHATIAYGDHTSDFPMLAAVQQGVIISGNNDIKQQALSHGFSVINI